MLLMCCLNVAEVALVAVLVPVLVLVLTTPVLVMVCSWLWKNRSVKKLSQIISNSKLKLKFNLM